MWIRQFDSLVFIGVGCVIALAGCQTTVIGPAPPTPGPRTAAVSSNLQEDSLAGSLNSEEAVMTDPSAARLHDIAGDILLYRVYKGNLPQQLAQLKETADDEVNLICPLTNTPYVYVPGGLHYPGRNKSVIVYEPAPRPNGTRWCILMADAAPGTAQSLEVLQLPEATFLAYQ